MYKLKPNVPGFEIVDGPFAGRKFEPGVVYEDIPGSFKDRFVKIKPQKLQKNTKKENK